MFALAWLKRRAVRAICAHVARATAAAGSRCSSGARACAMAALAVAAAASPTTRMRRSRLRVWLRRCCSRSSAAFARGAARLSRRARARGALVHARAGVVRRAAWLDATAPLGFGLLGSAYALAALRLALRARPGLWLEILLLVTPLWLTGTRLQISSAGVARPAPDRAA